MCLPANSRRPKREQICWRYWTTFQQSWNANTVYYNLEDETNRWTVLAEMEDEEASLCQRKASYLVFRARNRCVNDANINRLFNIDLECGSVWVNRHALCSVVPVIASSTNNPETKIVGHNFQSLAHKHASAREATACCLRASGIQ